MRLLKTNTTRIQKHVRHLYGSWCVWCGEQTAFEPYHPVIHGLERRKDNALGSCVRCHEDRGDDSVSAYALRARRPNHSMLWNALRTCVASGGLLGKCAGFERIALWEGVSAEVPENPFEKKLSRRARRQLCAMNSRTSKTKRDRLRTDARIQKQRALYGDWCVWCGGATDPTIKGHEVLRCCTRTAVNHVRACQSCADDRGELPVSDYILIAKNPNLSVLWSALRNVVNRDPLGLLADAARIEQAALWQGVGSGVMPLLMSHEEAIGVALKHIRQAAAQRDGYCCVWCSKPLTERTATAEHLLPKSAGGSNSLHNIAIACLKCNNTRQSIPVEEWASQSPAPRIDVLQQLGFCHGMNTLVAA